MLSPKTLLTLLALGATVSSFTVPEGLSDGVYEFDASNGTHVKVRDVTPLSRVYRAQTPERRDTMERRDNIAIGCFPKTVAADDLAKAKLDVETLCGPGDPGMSVGPRRAVYQKIGGAVVYMCNYSWGYNPCAGSEINTAFDAINGQCNGQVGWWWQKDWSKSYGWDTADAYLCEGISPTDGDSS